MCTGAFQHRVSLAYPDLWFSVLKNVRYHLHTLYVTTSEECFGLPALVAGSADQIALHL